MLKTFREVLIITLPKVLDTFSTHLYRSISLLNTDYKIIAQKWANRLGELLNELIEDHQRGFIPGRDGRENILKTQVLYNYYNWKKENGLFLFLDQEKAFNRVSHQALKIILKKLQLP